MGHVVIDVMLKPEILDPQGQAVNGALPRLGFGQFTDVRQGKRFVLTVDGARVAYRILQPGEIVHATMRSGGTLRTGDAGALTVAMGSEAPKAVGPSGAVRTIALRPQSR